MHDVIITLVTEESIVRDEGSYEMEQFYPITKVFRLEFETEGDFMNWLAQAPNFGILNVEQLKANGR